MTEQELRIGRKVRTNRDFSGVPAGTIGEIVPAANSWPDSHGDESFGVAIRWNRHEGDTLTDWFAMDELQYLDV